MKVLIVASEAVPFVKTGGLADVIGSLPKALKAVGIDIRVMLPKYGDIPIAFKQQMVFKKKITVPVGCKEQHCGIDELKYNGVTFYFIDNEHYFKRAGLYGFADDAERYALFCRAVLEALPHLGFTPDILHCHDWHTGMVSVFLDSDYKTKSFYSNIVTIFTIHNLQYQGVFPREILKDVLDLSEEYFTMDGVEFYGQVSFMKGGLNFSNIITTVSNTYAEEILYPYFGEKLDGLLRHRKNDLYGILNGLDYQEYNPVKDAHIFTNFHKNALLKRRENKLKLQKQLNLPVNKQIPLIAIISRLVNQKGLDLIEHVLDDILAMDVQMVVLGTGDKKYQHLFLNAANRYPHKVSANIMFDNTLAHKIYAGSDMFLMPSLFEPCGLGQLIALRYGSIPIVRETGGLNDTINSYNDITGEGNGFSFTNYNAHDMLHTIKRAIEYYHQKKIWHKIIKNAMGSDYSWKQSAKKYKRLYQHLLEKIIKQSFDVG